MSVGDAVVRVLEEIQGQIERLTNQGQIYVPLLISPSDSPGPPQTVSLPEITFRAPVDLEIFWWRLYEGSGNVPAWNRYGHAVSEGDPVSLMLDAPAGKEMTLDVDARPNGADDIKDKFKVLRP